MKKSVILGFVVAVVVAFLLGYCGSRPHLTEEVDAAEPAQTWIEQKAEEYLNEFNDEMGTKLEEAKREGYVKDYSITMERMDEFEGCYIYHVKVTLPTNVEVGYHVFGDIIDDNGVNYFTMDGKQVDEDVFDILTEDLDVF